MRTLSILAGLGIAFTLSGVADAGYTNLSVTSVDATVVLDPDNPVQTAVTIHRVWANFTDPQDALFVWGGGGALGSAIIRNFNAAGTGPGGGFLNHVFENNVQPPNASPIVSNSDTYFTIGVAMLNQIPAGQGVSLITIPGTPAVSGTVIDLSDGGGITTTPTTSGGAPNPITLAGFADDGDADLRVLLMQLVVQQGELVAGRIGVTVNPDSLEGGSTTLEDQFFGEVDIGADVHPDFNNDGFADIAIGVPGKNRGAISNSGAVIVMYGNTGSINDNNASLWHQDTGGMVENCEANDALGSALAWGDFDGDGFDDIAIGVPGESIGAVENAGAVHVVYGRTNQITPQNGELWHQNRPGVPDQAEQGDQFGAALVAGDFDGDGHDDLAIGVIDEDILNANRAGAVHVLYGSKNGLRGNGSQFFTAGSPDLTGNLHANDHFGSALGAGDFDGDGAEDLAIGAPFKEVQGRADAGVVYVMYGAGGGLTGAGSQFWHQGSLGVGVLEAFDQFGETITTGDFNGDGLDDLAVGVPSESIPPGRDCGAVNVAYGSVTGLTSTGAQFFDVTQILGGVPRDDDHFGEALACGDLDDDTFDELIIGTPSRKLSGFEFAGAVGMIHGSGAGLNILDLEFWTERSITNLEDFEEGDRFGAALMCADFDGDGIDDLAVGVPGEVLTGIGGAGGVIIVAVGTLNGIEQDTGFVWGQASIGESGAGGDEMGSVLPN